MNEWPRAHDHVWIETHADPTHYLRVNMQEFIHPPIEEVSQLSHSENSWC